MKRSAAMPGVLEIYRPDVSTGCAVVLFMVPVRAGFPSPAEDYIEGRLDLNAHLIKHPAATFFVRVTGDSMIDAGIHPGDIMIVDRSLEPSDRRVVVAVIDGELTVKRIRMIDGRVFLMPANDRYPPIAVQEETEVTVWGVVTSVIHPLL